MTVGEKIKFIRNFRDMTQKELGVGIGFDEKGADNRIAIMRRIIECLRKIHYCK